MIGSTCEKCWDGRHIRCEAKGTCECSVCGITAAKPLRQRVTRRPSNSGGTHPSQAAQRTKHLAGRHALAGYSSLAADVQLRIAQLLEQGETLSAIAREVGCSRDQVRTIRNRELGATHRELRAEKRNA